jgi:hypothetical protein
MKGGVSHLPSPPAMIGNRGGHAGAGNGPVVCRALAPKWHLSNVDRTTSGLLCGRTYESLQSAPLPRVSASPITSGHCSLSMTKSLLESFNVSP